MKLLEILNEVKDTFRNHFLKFFNKQEKCGFEFYESLLKTEENIQFNQLTITPDSNYFVVGYFNKIELMDWNHRRFYSEQAMARRDKKGTETLR